MVKNSDQIKPEIFIGSSNEALNHAKKTAEIVENCGAIPILWNESFKLGDIPLLAIEQLTSRVLGAILLLTPDDDSVIRKERVRVPRANVVFEYGYFTAALTRNRVVLCVYDDTKIPSDLAGLTVVLMGKYPENMMPSIETQNKLREWILNLPRLQQGFYLVINYHGYSGQWEITNSFTRWRGRDINSDESVYFKGSMVLLLQADGKSVTGHISGTLYVEIKNCYAEYAIIDEIDEAYVDEYGSLKMKVRLVSRLEIKREGEPPQKDGFEPSLRGHNVFDVKLNPDPRENRTLKGIHENIVADKVHSHTTQTYRMVGEMRHIVSNL